jgi:glycosyltransferase involved in cell wall biosynthesis
MAPRVSVILPTYNRVETLRAAIFSVLHQSVRDLELIVVDDASPQDVAGLVRSIDDPRLIYVRREENGGAAAARNTGLALARGEFIAFQDSDDLWLPSKLDRQLALFAMLPDSVGAVVGAKILYGRDENGEHGPGKVSQAPAPQSRLALNGDQLAHLLTENRISVQSSLFRTACMPGRAWFDPLAKANEDWEFAIRLARRVTIYEDCVPVVLAFVSHDSLSKNKRRECIGALRLLKTNRQTFLRYPRQQSLLLLDIARCFYGLGKYKRCMGFVTKSVSVRPTTVVPIIGSLLRSVLKRAFNKSMLQGKSVQQRELAVMPQEIRGHGILVQNDALPRIELGQPTRATGEWRGIGSAATSN